MTENKMGCKITGDTCALQAVVDARDFFKKMAEEFRGPIDAARAQGDVTEYPDTEKLIQYYEVEAGTRQVVINRQACQACLEKTT